MIPIKCHTCGAVLADKYRYYLEQVRKRKLSDNNTKSTIFMTSINCEKTHEGIELDNLHITRACCRIRMLTHVDLLK